MKKIIFLLLFSFAFSMISCNNSHKNYESFANVVKEDSSRINELLHVADSINKFNENKEDTDTTSTDIINEGEGREIRKPEPLVIDSNHLPLIKFPVYKIKKFIRNNELSRKDTLYFCLGTYKSQRSVDRYNKRNPGKNYKIGDLQGKPTLLLKFTKESSLAKQQFLDGATLCPPPPDCVTQ